MSQSSLRQQRVVDPVLTSLSTGYTNAELVGSVLFPFAPVDKEGGKIPRFGKEAFMAYETERAVGADSNLGKLGSINPLDFALEEHDLGIPVDYREQEESWDNALRRANSQSLAGMRLVHEIKTAAISTNPANYAVGNKLALAGENKFSHANSDPEAVINAAKDAISDKVVLEPNTMLIGALAWRALKGNAKLKAILSDNAKRLVRLDDLREIFEIQNIVIGRGVKTTDKGVASKIWGNNIVLAYVPAAQSGAESDSRVPSYGYTLRKRGYPQADQYTKAGGKVTVVRNTDIYQPLLMGAEAGYLLSEVA